MRGRRHVQVVQPQALAVRPQGVEPHPLSVVLDRPGMFGVEGAAQPGPRPFRIEAAQARQAVPHGVDPQVRQGVEVRFRHRPVLRCAACQFVVAPAQELQDADAVAVRVAQMCDAAPGVRDGRIFQVGAGRDRLLHGAIHVFHHHVQMHGRPVPRVVARLPRRAGRRRAGGLFQQIDGRIGAQHFRRVRAQPPMQGQSESALIEADGVFKIGDVDVDQDTHGCSFKG